MNFLTNIINKIAFFFGPDSQKTIPSFGLAAILIGCIQLFLIEVNFFGPSVYQVSGMSWMMIGMGSLFLLMSVPAISMFLNKNKRELPATSKWRILSKVMLPICLLYIGPVTAVLFDTAYNIWHGGKLQQIVPAIFVIYVMAFSLKAAAVAWLDTPGSGINNKPLA